MGNTYPTFPRAAFLAWCKAHTEIFAATPTAIGISAAQATAFTALVEKADGDSQDQDKAREAAKAATQKSSTTFSDLKAMTGDLVRTIRAFAESHNDPNVYVLAQIPSPATPTPVPPPAQPTNLSVTLDASNGQLTLHWKATNPVGSSGTSYIVRRKLPTQSEFTFVGVTGSKKFTDTTFTAGPDSVQYTIQGQRGDSTGPLSNTMMISFGRAPGGGLTAMVGEEGEDQVRLAA